MTYPIPYLGSHDWIPARTVLLTRFGSRAHGTATPESDEDFRAVAVPPRRYRDGFRASFEQEVLAGDPDLTTFSLAKTFHLAAQSNPNLIEVLWAVDQDVLLATPAGRALRDMRARFLSRRVLGSFRYYALEQLRKIKAHRGYIMDPPLAPPDRAAFGLQPMPEVSTSSLDAALRAVGRRVDQWSIDYGDMPESGKLWVREQIETMLAELEIASDQRWQAAARLVGFAEDLVQYLHKEALFRKAQEKWKSYVAWQNGRRNPARLALEIKYGFDVKHGSHLIRLLSMGAETLQEGGVVRVRRPDWQMLLWIKQGGKTYEELVEMADGLSDQMLTAAQTSPLPERPPMDELDEACCALTRMVDDENPG